MLGAGDLVIDQGPGQRPVPMRVDPGPVGQLDTNLPTQPPRHIRRQARGSPPTCSTNLDPQARGDVLVNVGVELDQLRRQPHRHRHHQPRQHLRRVQIVAAIGGGQLRQPAHHPIHLRCRSGAPPGVNPRWLGQQLQVRNLSAPLRPAFHQQGQHLLVLQTHRLHHTHRRLLPARSLQTREGQPRHVATDVPTTSVDNSPLSTDSGETP